MALLQASGRWGRFDRYEIADGRIRPARDADFAEYGFGELWSDRAMSRKDYQTPLAAALQLIGDLESLTGTPAEREKKHDTLLCAYASRFGLLGLLACETAYVRSAGLEGAERFEIIRAGGGFIRHDIGSAVEKDEGETLVIAPDFQDDTGLSVVRYPRADGRAVGWFETEDFWRRYSEGVFEFVDSLRELRDALRAAKAGESSAWLLYLLSGTSLWAAPGPVLEVRCSSLLSLVAATGIQGDSGDWKLQECRCGRMFVQEDPRQKYHDAPCRERFKKRDQRNPKAGAETEAPRE